LQNRPSHKRMVDRLCTMKRPMACPSLMEGVSSGKDILFEESLYRDLDGRGGEVVDTVGGRVRFLVGVTLQEPLQTR